MFSIPVSELTAEVLSKAEYWRFMQLNADQHTVAETLHRSRIEVDTSFTGWNRVLRLQWEADDWLSYDSDVHCFPVTFTPDGTEVRLECPRMPDEPMIEEWQGFSGAPIKPARQMLTPVSSTWWCLVVGFRQYREANAPTPEHSPRLSLEGVWVWSTRK